jgi:chemotaxis protein MotB
MNARPKYYDSEVSHRWMLSYVDVLTILLILFVAVSAQTLHSRTAAGGQPPPPGRPSPFRNPPAAEPRPLLFQVKRRLEQQGIYPKLEARGLVISLPHAVLFPSGQDQISPAGMAVVGQIAQVLHAVPNKVSLAGHAGAVPVHSGRFKSNGELSAARSLEVLELLTNKYGIAETRVSVAGYGSTIPKDTNDTKDGRAASRRVEIVILDVPVP